ncbi:MAG: hypothetical protein KDD40_12475, partial [Bdellovibrionales bacterium]|nr:hypothetical protein [Bdellovibrionales bacterium]
KEQKFLQHKDKIKNWIMREDSKMINAWAKAQKLKWEESGSFKLNARFIPKLSALKEENVSKFLIAARDKKIWVPDIVTANGQNYILKVKDFKFDTKAQPGNQNLDFQKEMLVGDAFRSWLDQKKKTAHIERNQQILMQ